ncbi:MAG: molybdopterin oxidoreductase [Planctomycetota bacterium]|nr:MAG: molybdopterin oxidoreductase [Planctomycetota bacterium]
MEQRPVDDLADAGFDRPGFVSQSGDGGERGTCAVVAPSAAAADPSCGDAAQEGGLLAELLGRAASLSAVDLFSQWHNGAGDRLGRTPSWSRYSSLLPAAPPGEGEQYGFEVDLDRCSGCKACVVACHTLNGLDEAETWRDVGLLVGGSRTAPVMQHVTAACHHCLQPACMTACPVNAYEKDPVTGIVKHLDDQCFGCQYCTMACPYDVPKYSAGKGIVRKCDMCSARLAVGEPPACVQACPHEAIAIRVVNQRQLAEDAEAALFLPAAPDPQLTLPATAYKTRRAFPRNLLPADYYRVHSQHAHWPLVIMLVLTQLSVGAFVAGWIADLWTADVQEHALRPLYAASALAFGLLALAASLFHLGRPQYAYRAVLGIKHSWLSREIVAFGLFALLAVAYAAAVAAAQETAWLGSLAGRLARWTEPLRLGVTVFGAVGVACSAMIYIVTRRECWSGLRVALRFVLTAAILGVAAYWLSVLLATAASPAPQLTAIVRRQGPAHCRLLIALAAFKLAWEAAIFRHLLSLRMTPLRRSAMLLGGELASTTLARFALSLLGGIVMPALLLHWLQKPFVDVAPFVTTTGMLFVACLAGELLERRLFFAACAAPRMPGGIR